MADPRYPNSDDDAGAGRNQEATTGAPRWVKVFGVIAAVLVLLAVAMMFLAGEHGPGRHTPLDGTVDQPPHSGLAADLILPGRDLRAPAPTESSHQ